MKTGIAIILAACMPGSLGTTKTNGCLAPPLVQDIDNDGKYEIILNTVYSGVTVYDYN
jgi:hypothetical protein